MTCVAVPCPPLSAYGIVPRPFEGGDAAGIAAAFSDMVVFGLLAADLDSVL